MGKNGKALREAKRLSTTYTFTREQLEERDARLLREHQEKINAKATAAVKEEWNTREERMLEVITEEWEERAKKFNSDDFNDNMIEFTRLAMLIPLRMLVEHFGWKPAKPTKTGGIDGRYAIIRLHDLCAIAINDIGADELKDIRKYAEECEQITGTDFRLKEEGWT